MREEFDKAKAKSREISLSKCIDMRSYHEGRIISIMKEAQEFRDMLHAIEKKATGNNVDKILFSWEEI